MEQQKSIERVAIDNKLKTAANMRDENIKKMLERLKEHVSDLFVRIQMRLILIWIHFNSFHFNIFNYFGFWLFVFHNNQTEQIGD